MNGGVGISGEGAKGVSTMQHGHLILLQLEVMHEPVYDMSMQPVPYMVAPMVQWCTIVRHKGH